MSDGVAPFTASFDDDGSTLVVAGDLDAASAPMLVGAAEEKRPLSGLTIDAGGLSFVDSAGLRALLAVRGMVAADADAPTRLAHVGRDLRRLLEICGLVDAFVEI